jgi:glycine cleavage system H protein
MSETRYTRDHEYVRAEGAEAAIGITDYAQQQLGDVVFVELPNVGEKFAKGAQFAVVESVKAASEVYAPIAGEIVETNAVLDETPAKVNEDAQGSGWFVKLRMSDPAQFLELMDEAAYQAFLKSV